MIRGKFLANKGTVIIEDGVVHLFDLGGRYIGTDSNINSYMTGVLNFKYISIISSNNNVEIACFDSDKMRRFQCNEPASNCMMRIQMAGNILRVLNKSGKECNATYNQVIFIYKETTDVMSIINTLQVKEIF